MSKQGVMAAAYQWGYRIAMIVAGAAPLLLAESYSWNFSYAVMAALMGVGMLAVLLRAARGTPRHPPDPARRRPRLAPARDRRMAVAARLIVAVAACCSARARRRRARALAALVRHRLGALGDALTAAWRPPYGVWLPASLRGARVCRPRDRGLARSGPAHAPGSLPCRRLGRSAARFLHALSRQRRPDPGADLHLPAFRLRAQHHEPVLSRSRASAERSAPRCGRSSVSRPPCSASFSAASRWRVSA